MLATVKRGDPLISHHKFNKGDANMPTKSKDKTKVEHFDRNANRNKANPLFDFREFGARDRLVKDGLEVTVGQTVTLIISESLASGYSWIVDKEKAGNLWTT